MLQDSFYEFPLLLYDRLESSKLIFTGGNYLPDDLNMNKNYKNANTKVIEIYDLLEISLPNKRSDYADIIVRSIRKSVHNLKAIAILIDSSERFSDSALILTRQVIEDYISILYVSLDIDKYVARYRDYEIVSLYNQQILLAELSKLIDSSNQFSIKANVEKEYSKLNSKVKRNTYWSGISTIVMIKRLVEESNLKAKDGKNFEIIYSLVSSLIHTSPLDVHRFNSNDNFSRFVNFFADSANLFPAICITELIKMLMAELDMESDEITPKLEEIRILIHEKD